MRKWFAVVAFAICSPIANGKPSDWYSPSGSKDVISVGTVVDAESGDAKAFHISGGKINVPESYWSHLYIDDVGSYNALKALEQALISRNEVETLAETLDNLNFVTAMKIENGNLQYARGTPNERGEYDWIDAGPLNNYTVMTPDNANFNTLRAFFVYNEATEKWEQVAGSAQWYSAEVDAKTIVRESEGRSGALKVNHDGSLMIDSDKLSVKAYNAGGIGKDDEKGVYVITKKDTSGLTGGKEATSPGGGLAVNVDNATIGINGENKVEIKGASSNAGKMLQSNGASECKWLAAGDTIKFDGDKISVKVGDGLTDIFEDLSVNYGVGLIIGDDDTLGVNYGYGMYIADDETLGAYKYITKLENNEISLYERSVSDATEEKIGVSWGSIGADGKTLESFTEDNKVKTRIKGIENTDKILSSDGTNNKWISRGDGIDTTATDYIKVKGNDNKAITVDENGVGVECDSASIVVNNKKLKVGLSGSSGMEIENNGGLTLQRSVPQPLSGWNGSSWVKIVGGGAEPDGHSLSWVDPGHTNLMQIYGYDNRPSESTVPVAIGGTITWKPYNGGVAIYGTDGSGGTVTSCVFKAASDTAATFSVDTSKNPVEISVSVHWK